MKRANAADIQRDALAFLSPVAGVNQPADVTAPPDPIRDGEPTILEVGAYMDSLILGPVQAATAATVLLDVMRVLGSHIPAPARPNAYRDALRLLRDAPRHLWRL